MERELTTETVYVIEWWDGTRGVWVDMDEARDSSNAWARIDSYRANDADVQRYRVVVTTTESEAHDG